MTPSSAEPLNEFTKVEAPLLAQLQGMGWDYLPGDIDVASLTERQSFREVLLAGRLRAALRRININEQGDPWLDEGRITQALNALERLGAPRLMEANQAATHLLLKGTVVEGDPTRTGGRSQTVHFIDWQHPEQNDFLVVNQFRVDVPGTQSYIVPDVVLFVNGIPLVVIECKSPTITAPITEAITQLRRYTNQREEVEENEGVEKLFHTNQLLIGTDYYKAVVGSIGAGYEHFLEWKDSAPVPLADVAVVLGKAPNELQSQEILAAGMLRPAHLLDIVQNFTLFQSQGSRTLKVVPRYQQFRAVHRALQRLLTGQTRDQYGEMDQRGGIIWHTQGSGKSLTMVFLIRKLRALPALRRFKVVVVTDRTDLEEQLSKTAALTGETVRRARDTAHLKEMLREEGPDLVFAMIQKYREPDVDEPPLPFPAPPEPLRQVAESEGVYALGRTSETFGELNPSPDILVLVDEAHRSHANTLHANLRQALPNAAMIGFTGTPILMGEQKRTHEIFGPFIDTYTIEQSEQDGATVPILYEGRTAEGEVADGRSLDTLFEDMFRERTPAELEAIKQKYATRGNVLEAQLLIEAKAADMLRHYVGKVLPEGFKAQVVAYSRRAAVRYQAALMKARDDLLARLDTLDPALLALDETARDGLDGETRFLLEAHPHRATIERLAFAAIISGSTNDPPELRAWSDWAQHKSQIGRFKRELAEDGLAFLCVRTMLLTGFDAPVEQVLYLDRSMEGHDLLQAIARVNRTHGSKRAGLVVDYYGVAHHLKKALDVYRAEDVQGALKSIKDELPKLADRHQRVLALFAEQGIADIGQVDACVDLLADEKVRARFVVLLQHFLESLNTVLPRPEALPFVRDARTLGFINKAAANRYRDEQLSIAGVGHKVQALIDEHVRARGIDPRVPPISILDAAFESHVNGLVSPRAKASEMEHAARYHIRQHYQEDPIYYKKLSERLEAILQAFRDNWTELVEALRLYTEEVRAGQPQDETGLDPKTQLPFLNTLAAESGAEEREAKLALVEPTVALVELIRAEIRAVDFWRRPAARERLRRQIVLFLDDRDLVPFAKQEAVADQLVALAKHHHEALL